MLLADNAGSLGDGSPGEEGGRVCFLLDLQKGGGERHWRKESKNSEQQNTTGNKKTPSHLYKSGLHDLPQLTQNTTGFTKKTPYHLY